MKKETKVHLTYGTIIIILAIGVFTYISMQVNETQELLRSEVARLTSKLNTVDETLAALQETDTQIVQQVGDLSTDLEEKGTQILGLTSDVEQVQSQSIALEDQLSRLKAQNEDFSDIIEDVVPAVVSIQTNIGVGSGFFVRSGGYLVTNYHVIENARAGVAVTSTGDRLAIRIVGVNENVDIAVLEAEGGNFPRLRFGNSDDVRVGERVIAVGNPGGLSFSVTQGIVSSTNRVRNSNQYLQIDVPINPGNSGGPLIDADGMVIGVNSLKLEGFEGVGFAIVSNQVDDLVDEIIAKDQAEQ